MSDAIPLVARKAWGEEVAAAFASWVDEIIREYAMPGQAIRPLDRARKRAWLQSAPSFLQETLGEEGAGKLVEWLYGRLKKRVSEK